MISPSEPEPPPSWPPRHGRTFFLLWSAGVLAAALLDRVITITGPNYSPPPSSHSNAGVHAIYLSLIAAQAAWEAWLLFRPGWRFGGWIALPLVMYVVSLKVMESSLSAKALSLVVMWPMAGLIPVIFQAALLIGVRRRPWAWWLASLGAVILSSGGAFVLNWSSMNWLLAEVTSLVPQVIGDDPVASVFSGLELLAEVGAAAVLAWWMPPVATAVDASPTVEAAKTS